MELLEKVLEKDNLKEAYRRVYANKGVSGVDGVRVEELENYLKDHIAEISESIRKRQYQPQPVLRVEIPKSDGKKRKLGIPTLVDRVIQQAIAQVLTPIYEEQFSDSSFGFRPKRSCEMAVVRSLELLNDGYDWIVDIDLEKFFDTVHHDRLMNILQRTIKDGDLLSLIRKYLKSGVMVENQYQETTIGTPQGGNLSPLLSNVMLNELDKELEARGLNFVRYADDCNIFVKSEKAANRVMASVSKYIETKLGLKVNPSKSKVGKPQDIKFLGFGYYKGKDDRYHPRVHEVSLDKLKKKLKRLTKRSWSISLDNRLKRIKQAVVGWVNYFRIADMKTAMIKMDSKLRMRIRVIIWKQWKVAKKRIPALMKLGASADLAYMTAHCRKRYQFVCKTYGITTTITNKRLEKRGLVSLLSLYNNVHLVL